MSRRQVRHVVQWEGKLLRIARLDAGLTQEQLARALSVTLRTVTRWEDGTNQPKGATVLALSRELDVHPDQFFRENGRVA